MKRFMDSIISPNQSTFVHGRQILDANLFANELIESRTKSGKPRILLRLDIEKAFDHVNWEFLYFCLH
ncbi:unnamed protein product [Linum trigynum]|uniref:Reverse transcriptase domain-containing protein n=1 Tax=Linum trigynum TaxID=586398 RepID=A0AAV2CL03_9ROSI